MYDVYGEKVAIGDLSLVDLLLGDAGFLTGVNLYLAPTVSEEDIRQHLVSILPQSVLLTTPQLRSDHLAKTSEALRINLVFLSALSLFVAVLFGFQIVSLLLLRRRRDVATLVSVGASPSVLSRLVMGEALTLGLLGGALGGIGGHLLGEYTVRAVRGTVNTLYLQLTSEGFAPDLFPFFEGVAVGAFIGILSGFFPALTVQRRAPLSYFSREHSAQRLSLHPKVAAGMALVFVVIAYGTSEEFFMRGGKLLPFLSPTALSTAILLIAPLLLLGLFSRIQSIFHLLTSATQIGLQNIKMRLGDSALAVGALAVTFGLLIGVSTMVSSFRVTFNGWLQTVLAADLFLTPTVGPQTSPSTLHAAVKLMRENGLTEGVQSGRQLSYVYDGAQIFIRSIDAPLAHRMNTLVSLGDRELQWQIFESGSGVVVSESFSRKLGVTTGDTITLMGRDEQHLFEVAGVMQDFSSDLGAILMDQERYESVFGDAGVFTGISVFLRDTGKAEEFHDFLESHFPDVFQVTDREGLRETALKIFDGTFAITYVLQLITTVIASLFLILLLITSVLDARSEQLTLRSIGSPFSFLRRVLISESVAIVASAALLGALFGLLLSCLLVYRVNIVFFGWTVAFVFPWALLGTFLCGVFVMAVVVPAIVAHYTLRKIPVEVLRYE
jgi:putative ABC transport system permease protein